MLDSIIIDISFNFVALWQLDVFMLVSLVFVNIKLGYLDSTSRYNDTILLDDYFLFDRFSHLDGFLKPFDVLDTLGMSAFITYFIFVAALTVSFMLMGLICWHARMISHGVTSIERILHQDYVQQCTKQGHIFINPYDFGLLENWKRFFNVYSVGEFIRRILLPSTHQPKGNGITWDNSDVHLNLQSKVPVAFPPDVYLNHQTGYPINSYQSVIPSWGKQPEPANSLPDLEPNVASTETMELKKDR